jgi:lactoylglutathione lyase
MSLGLLDHVTMRVADLEASMEWYGEHFDYEEKGRRETGDTTGVFLGPEGVHEAGALLELASDGEGRTPTPGDAWGHIAVRTPDPYGAYEALREAGVEGHRGPEETPGTYAFVRDPDGHVVELSQRDYGAPWSLDHVMVRTDDPTVTIGWYAHVLDYDPYWRSENEDYRLYNVAPREAPREAAEVQLGYEYEGPFTTGDAWGHVAVRTQDVRDAWATLLYRGAEEYRDPDRGDRRAATRDPEGHEVELFDPADRDGR